MSVVIQNLSHTYHSAGLDPRPVLHPIPQLVLSPSEPILLRGISGSGKTTLFNILAGLMRPTQGEVFIEGQALYALREAQRDQFRAQRIGYVFQQHNLLPMLSALENVMMPLAFAAVPLPARRARAHDLLAAVGLADQAHHRPAHLSTGQRLRVAVARALAASPRLLLADEPTAALDAESGAQVMDLLLRHAHDNNAILLVASHDPALSERFGRVLNIRAGVVA